MYFVCLLYLYVLRAVWYKLRIKESVQQTVLTANKYHHHHDIYLKVTSKAKWMVLNHVVKQTCANYIDRKFQLNYSNYLNSQSINCMFKLTITIAAKESQLNYNYGDIQEAPLMLTNPRDAFRG